MSRRAWPRLTPKSLCGCAEIHVKTVWNRVYLQQVGWLNEMVGSDSPPRGPFQSIATKQPWSQNLWVGCTYTSHQCGGSFFFAHVYSSLRFFLPLHIKLLQNPHLLLQNRKHTSRRTGRGRPRQPTIQQFQLRSITQLEDSIIIMRIGITSPKQQMKWHHIADQNAEVRAAFFLVHKVPYFSKYLHVTISV